MSTETAILKEALTREAVPADHVTPPLIHPTHPTRTAGAHRPTQQSGGALRLLATRLVQEQLLRIGRAAQLLEKDLAALLHSCAARNLHRSLGYRRLADYLADGPGLSLGTCRRLIRLDRTRASARDSRTGSTLSSRGVPSPGAILEGPLFEGAAGPGPSIWLPEPAPSREGIADFDVWMEVTRAVREALRPLGPGTAPESPAPEPPLAERPLPEREEAPGLFDEGPRSEGLDAALRARVRRAQALAWRRGPLLAAAARHHLYRDLGHATLDDWGRDALGLSPACVDSLMRMNELLRARPAIEDAFRRGLLTWSRAVEAVRAARPDTERAWVKEARRLPIERLRRAAGAADISAAGGDCAR